MANSIAHTYGHDESGIDVIEATVDSFTGLYDVADGACTLHGGYVHVGADTDFLLVWDDASPTLGTTAPRGQIPTGVDGVFQILEGGSFSNGLTFTCANVGGTVCSGAPTNSHTIRLVVEV